jgi:hypothetical protein
MQVEFSLMRGGCVIVASAFLFPVATSALQKVRGIHKFFPVTVGQIPFALPAL